MTNNLIVTIDLDWACEASIEETLDFLITRGIFPTVFATHRSPCVEGLMDKIEVGLHPFFGHNSSHGSTIAEVVSCVMDLPHNLNAFRCHRFANCNASRQAMAEAGMVISSNVCTDLEVVTPFKDRFGLLEVPIFLEDGGYLWRNHPLKISHEFEKSLTGKGNKVIIIHPMHFSLNTPNFAFMSNIKQSMDRDTWKSMTKSDLERLCWKRRGIKDFLIELVEAAPSTCSLGSLKSNLPSST